VAGELEVLTRQMFESLKKKDAASVIGMGAEDIQGVDEISRQWLGAGQFGPYIEQLVKMVDEVDTTLSDVHETVRGDVGILTCWIEQDYTLEGHQEHVSAPTPPSIGGRAATGS
jgi:ketosteroid isomerase-like protein